MEIRLVVNLKLGALAFFLLNILASNNVNAKDEHTGDEHNNGTIRFYKINKHEQSSKIAVAKKKSSATGCHNFRFRPRVFTVVQTGFNACSLYTKRDCLAPSLIKASHSKSDAFAENLIEGHAWQVQKQSEKDTRGVKLSSWSCR